MFNLNGYRRASFGPEVKRPAEVARGSKDLSTPNSFPVPVGSRRYLGALADDVGVAPAEASPSKHLANLALLRQGSAELFCMADDDIDDFQEEEQDEMDESLRPTCEDGNVEALMTPRKEQKSEDESEANEAKDKESEEEQSPAEEAGEDDETAPAPEEGATHSQYIVAKVKSVDAMQTKKGLETCPETPPSPVGDVEPEKTPPAPAAEPEAKGETPAEAPAEATPSPAAEPEAAPTEGYKASLVPGGPGVQLVTSEEGNTAQLYTTVERILNSQRILDLPLQDRYALAGKVAAVPKEFPRLIERLASNVATAFIEASALNALNLLEICKELVPGFKDQIPEKRVETAAELSLHPRAKEFVLQGQRPSEWARGEKQTGTLIIMPEQEEETDLVTETGRAVSDATKFVGGAAFGGVGLVSVITKNAQATPSPAAEPEAKAETSAGRRFFVGRWRPPATPSPAAEPEATPSPAAEPEAKAETPAEAPAEVRDDANVCGLQLQIEDLQRRVSSQDDQLQDVRAKMGTYEQIGHHLAATCKLLEGTLLNHAQKIEAVEHRCPQPCKSQSNASEKNSLLARP